MIEIITVLTKEVQKSMTKKIWIGSWIALTIGAIGMLLYIFADPIWGTQKWTEFLLIFALPFGFGLVYIIMLNKIYKKPFDERNVNIYQFEPDGFTVVTFRGGANTGSMRVSYDQIAKVKETADYLFLFVNKFSAFAVKKADSSPSDIETIKSYLGVK